MRTFTYQEIIWALGDRLALIATMEPADAARALAPLLDRAGPGGVEILLTNARRAAVEEVVRAAGSQRGAAEMIGMNQGNVSRLLSGRPGPSTFGKMAGRGDKPSHDRAQCTYEAGCTGCRPEPKRKQRKAVGSGQ